MAELVEAVVEWNREFLDGQSRHLHLVTNEPKIAVEDEDVSAGCTAMGSAAGSAAESAKR